MYLSFLHDVIDRILSLKCERLTIFETSAEFLINLHSEAVSSVRLLSEFRQRHLYITAFERDFNKSRNLYTQEHALTNARKDIFSPFIEGDKYYLQLLLTPAYLSVSTCYC